MKEAWGEGREKEDREFSMSPQGLAAALSSRRFGLGLGWALLL